MYALEAHTTDKITHVGNWDMKTISQKTSMSNQLSVYIENLYPRTNVFKACLVIEKFVPFVYTTYIG